MYAVYLFEAFRRASCLAVCVSVTLLFAQGASAQQGPAWRLASETGSLRLYRTALVAERPEGAAKALADIDRRLGIVGRNGPQQYALSPSVSLTPELGYDRNFNGGLESDTVRIGGQHWRVTPETRAQDSIYAGARLAVGQRFVWGAGRAVSVQSSGTYRRALDNGMDYRALSVQACSENQLRHLSALDMCLSRSLVYRDRGTTKLSVATVGLSHIFVQDNALSEASVTLGREFRPDNARNTASLHLRHLDRTHGAFSTRIFIGERVQGRSLTTVSAQVEHGRFIADRFYQIGLSHQRETGGQLLGQQHHRHEYGITLMLPVVFGLTPSIGYRRLRHDLSEFDGNHATFSIALPAYRF
ncbi:MAG: hypothetical protein EA338_11590 [Roseinatronobacter sp.]|nr:MAG: hypothetical protein EA338_11590 [Roseinatronobacter sp.]